MIERLLIGIVVSSGVALAGWYSRSLSGSGAVAAVVVGAAVIWGTSWEGALLLGTFFVSSSLLSKLTPDRTLDPKGSQRDALQVLANGGVAALAGLAGLTGDELVVLTVLGGSLAAANADTWATEIGGLSGRPPRFIFSDRVPVTGESGAVTTLGTLGSVAGALLLGMAAALTAALNSKNQEAVFMLAIVTVAGIAGSTADSLAGEFLQSKRRCPSCGVITEARAHHCGELAVDASGLPWVDNDVVNVICTTTGAAIGLAAALLVFQSG